MKSKENPSEIARQIPLFGIPFNEAVLIPELGTINSLSGKKLAVDSRIVTPYQQSIFTIADASDPHFWCRAELSTAGVARFNSINMAHGAMYPDFSFEKLYEFFLNYWSNKVKTVHEEWTEMPLPRLARNLVAYNEAIDLKFDPLTAAESTFSGSFLRSKGFHASEVKQLRDRFTGSAFVSAFFTR